MTRTTGPDCAVMCDLINTQHRHWKGYITFCTIHANVQVSADDFADLENCIASGDFKTCEAVPAGETTGRLSNPIAAFAIDMAGPALYES